MYELLAINFIPYLFLMSNCISKEYLCTLYYTYTDETALLMVNKSLYAKFTQLI